MTSRIVAVFFLALSAGPSGAGPVHINEFMASNPGRPLDPDAELDMDGSSPDWIELKNTSDAAVDLAGWGLTDNPSRPGKWMFPRQVISPGGYLKVYASGKNRAIAGVQLHTSWKLGEQEAVLLSRPDGAGSWIAVSQIGTKSQPYPLQRPGIAYGYPNDDPAQPPGYLLSDTPGTANGTAVLNGFVSSPSFSVERGFYEAEFALTVSNVTAGAALVYTLNGSEPSEDNGTRVLPAGPDDRPAVRLAISDSTLVRARGIKAGWGPSDIATHTYIFWDRVRTQSGPLPTTGITMKKEETAWWGASGALLRSPAGPDWEVDPEVVNHRDPASRFVYDDLKSLPSVSLVTGWKGLFGPSTPGVRPADGGIYVGLQAGVSNEGVDRVFSFEYLNPPGSTSQPNAVPGFQVDGRAHVFGGSSSSRWKSYKLSLNFKPVRDVAFDAYGGDAAETQRRFILDARFNSTWIHPDSGQRAMGDYARDEVMSDLQNSLGGQAPRGRWVHLFLNGLYWGIYSLHERPDEDFQAAYAGGDADDWDVFKHTLASATADGSDALVNSGYVNPALPIAYSNSTALANFNQLLGLFGVTFASKKTARDLRRQADYDPVWTRLDRQPFLDYLLLNFLAGNEDWSSRNYYASYLRTDPAAKWRYHSWDAEQVFRRGTFQRISFSYGNAGKIGSPHHFHSLLSVNAEYRLAFADTVQRHMFNTGALTVAGLQAAFQRRYAEIDRAIRGESARWGDNRRAAPHTRGADWLAERNRVLNSVVPKRHATMLAAFRRANLYPPATVPAPVFNVFGGAVSNGFPLVISAPGGSGTIYYTLDGADPRQAWTGSAAGARYAGPVLVTQPVTVKARFRSSRGVWSALTEAAFVSGVPARASNLPGSGAGEDAETLPNDPMADRNGNQRPDLLDYAVPDGLIHLAGWWPDGMRVTVNRALAADGARTVVEYSPDLKSWTELNSDLDVLERVRQPGDLLSETWRHNPGAAAGCHYRIKVETRPSR